MKGVLMVLAVGVLAQDDGRRQEALRLRAAAEQQAEHDVAGAIHKEQAALKLFEELGDSYQVGVSHRNLANLWLRQGEYARAVEAVVKAIEAARRLYAADVEDSAVGTFYAIVRDASRRLDNEVIEKMADSVLAAIPKESAGVRIGVRATMYEYFFDLRQAPRAVAVIEEALKECREAGYRWGEAHMLHARGHCYGESGEVTAARRDYEAALKLRQEINDVEGIGWSENNLGYLLFLQRSYAEAEERLLRAVKAFRSLDHREGLKTALRNLAMLYGATGESDKARAMAEEVKKVEGLDPAPVPKDQEISVGGKRVEDFKPGEKLLEVTWDGSQFVLTGPLLDGRRATVAAEDQYGNVAVNGVLLQVRRQVVWAGQRMVFLAKGETAVYFRGGYLAPKR